MEQDTRRPADAETAAPLRREALVRRLGDHPWAERVIVLDETDSTNNDCKRLAAGGAPHGTVVIAERQTAGRGRMGRSFASPPGVGLYLSAILRPEAPAAELLHLTAMAAVAAADAVEAAAGLRPGIKWVNDLVWNGRKLAGILAELSLRPGSGLVDYAVVGVGINCNHAGGDFPPELRSIAVSLRQALGRPADRTACAAALIGGLCRMGEELLTGRAAWMARYAADCVTIGRDVQVLRGGTARPAHAGGVDEHGALLVTYADGTTEAVDSGEVSVRGMYGYL